MANAPQKPAVGHGDWNTENPRKVAKREPIGRVSNRAPGRGKSIFSGAEIISQVQCPEYATGWELIFGGAREKIPHGDFCFSEHSPCPYWRLCLKHPDGDNGYCDFIEVGDWQLEDSELHRRHKECDINREQGWTRTTI